MYSLSPLLAAQFKMFKFINRFYTKLGIWCSRKSEYEGIQIGVNRAYDRDTEVKVQQALALIRDVSPSRFMRIHREVRRIRISSIAGRLAEWDVTEKECIVNGNYLDTPEITLTEVAATLIHEATHARIDRLGIKYTEDRRRRIERICIMEEIRFAKKRPDGEKVIRDAELLLAEPDEFWTNKSQWEARLEALRNMDCPKWMYRFAERRIRKLYGNPDKKE